MIRNKAFFAAFLLATFLDRPSASATLSSSTYTSALNTVDGDDVEVWTRRLSGYMGMSEDDYAVTEYRYGLGLCEEKGVTGILSRIFPS